MSAAKVGQRHGIHDRARRRAESPFEEFARIGAGDGVHGVEAHAEPAAEQLAYGGEVEK